jgi:hypothetical protein
VAQQGQALRALVAGHPGAAVDLEDGRPALARGRPVAGLEHVEAQGLAAGGGVDHVAGDGDGPLGPGPVGQVEPVEGRADLARRPRAAGHDHHQPGPRAHGHRQGQPAEGVEQGAEEDEERGPGDLDEQDQPGQLDGRPRPQPRPARQPRPAGAHGAQGVEGEQEAGHGEDEEHETHGHRCSLLRAG